MKLSSFAIGRYAMSTIACVVGFLCRAFAMFLIVNYTSQALLSPRNWESWVLSDDKIRGVMVDPISNFFFNNFSVSLCSYLQLVVTLPEYPTTSPQSTSHQTCG